MDKPDSSSLPLIPDQAFDQVVDRTATFMRVAGHGHDRVPPEAGDAFCRALGLRDAADRREISLAVATAAMVRGRPIEPAKNLDDVNAVDMVRSGIHAGLMLAQAAGWSPDQGFDLETVPNGWTSG